MHTGFVNPGLGISGRPLFVCHQQLCRWLCRGAMPAPRLALVGAASCWPWAGTWHHYSGCVCGCAGPAAPLGDLGHLPLQVISFLFHETWHPFPKPSAWNACLLGVNGAKYLLHLKGGINFFKKPRLHGPETSMLLLFLSSHRTCIGFVILHFGGGEIKPRTLHISYILTSDVYHDAPSLLPSHAQCQPESLSTFMAACW